MKPRCYAAPSPFTALLLPPVPAILAGLAPILAQLVVVLAQLTAVLRELPLGEVDQLADQRPLAVEARRVDAAGERLQLEGDPAGAIQLGALHLRVADVVAPIADVVAPVTVVIHRLARLPIGEVVPDVPVLTAYLARVPPHLALRLSELDLPL